MPNGKSNGHGHKDVLHGVRNTSIKRSERKPLLQELLHKVDMSGCRNEDKVVALRSMLQESTNIIPARHAITGEDILQSPCKKRPPVPLSEQARLLTRTPLGQLLANSISFQEAKQQAVPPTDENLAPSAKV